MGDHDHHEGHEHGPEQQGEKPVFAAEIPFDQNAELNTQIIALMKHAMGERYYEELESAILSRIATDKDLARFFEEKDNVVSLKLKDGVVTALDSEGQPVGDPPIEFQLGDLMEKVIKEKRADDFESCECFSRLYRIYDTREIDRQNGTNAADELLRHMAGYAMPEPGKDAPSSPSKPPLTEDELEVRRETASEYRRGKIDRERTLQTAEDDRTDFNVIVALVEPTIQDDDAEEFEAHWPHLNYSYEVDELFREEPNPKAGYRENPFNMNRVERWNHETLRDLIQDCRNSRLYFGDVAEKIYTDRLDNFKERLKQAKVSETVTDLLENDLQNTYRKFKRLDAALKDVDKKNIPEDLEEIYPHRKELKAVIQYLGDYVVYGKRLVDLVEKLRFNPSQETQYRDRLMTEFQKEDDGAIAETPENRAKEALYNLFLYREPIDVVAKTADEAEDEFEGKDRVAHPREYSGELSHIWAGIVSGATSVPPLEWFFGNVELERPITFQDLNGRTFTVQGEWFTDYQSPIAAYRAAFEATGDLKQRDTGEWDYEVNETQTVSHINRILELGIAAYSVMQNDRSMQDILTDMNELGVEAESGRLVRFSGNMTDNVRDLHQALKIKDLNDLKQKGSDKEEAVSAERLKFIRIGSVIWQKYEGKMQDRAQEKEQKKQPPVKIKLQPFQVEEILTQLKETKKFDEAKLDKLKQALIGGAAVAIPDRGGAFSIHMEFENGFGMDIGGVFPNWETLSPMLGVGKSFDVTASISVTVFAGGGYVFGENGMGWSGAGAKITKRFEKVDFHVGAGVGFAEGSPLPVPFIGTGVSWYRPEKKYEEVLTKKMAEAHIDELDKSGDPYKTVTENPSKYPELKDFLYRIHGLSMLPGASRRELFLAGYELFKEGLQSEAIDESEPRWWERITGAGLIFVPLPPGIIPAIEIQMWSRKLVYRLASEKSSAEQNAEIEAQRALERSLSAQTGVTVSKHRLEVNGEFIWDTKRGKLSLKKETTSSINFEALSQQDDKFRELQNVLARDAKILVESWNSAGEHEDLLLIRPMEANGTVNLLIDADLKDDVVAVTNGGYLFLSVKKGKTLHFKRQDISFPFEDRGSPEETVIAISDNPKMTTELLKNQCPVFLERLSHPGDQIGYEWKVKPRSGSKQKTQESFKTWEEYAAWDAEKKGGERVTFAPQEDKREVLERLRSAVTIRTSDTAGTLEIRADIIAQVESIAESDTEFLKVYRDLTTDGISEMRNGTSIELERNFPKLKETLDVKLGAKLNSQEFEAAFLMLMIGSFRNLEGREKAQDVYKETLEGFHARRLRKLFTEYFTPKIADAAEREKKVEEATKYCVDEFLKIKIEDKGSAVASGSLFATIVGMLGTRGPNVGLRWHWNFKDTAEKYGLVGEQKLSVAAKDISGDVAKFWMETLSPYRTGLHKQEIPPKQPRDAYEKFQVQIFDNLHSPLALKLAPAVAAAFSPEEITQLAEMYERSRRTSDPPVIHSENAEALRKFLDLCDSVRQAELDGKTEMQFGANKEFKLELKTELSHGIYRRCGNPSGVLRENFAVEFEQKSSKPEYSAGYGEGAVGLETGYSRVDVSSVGAAHINLPKYPTGERPYVRQPAERPPEETEQPPTEQPPPEERPITGVVEEPDPTAGTGGTVSEEPPANTNPTPPGGGAGE